jgi:hypothetical protein
MSLCGNNFRYLLTYSFSRWVIQLMSLEELSASACLECGLRSQTWKMGLRRFRRLIFGLGGGDLKVAVGLSTQGEGSHMVNEFVISKMSSDLIVR